MFSVSNKQYTTLMNSLIKSGYFSGTLSNSLYALIAKYVYDDILKKGLSYKKEINDTLHNINNLEEKALKILSLLSKEEIQECFGPISKRFLPGNTVAVELSNRLKEYFLSLYNLDFLFHGIRDSDRKKILPNVREDQTVAIWYRIYPPNTECGLPHRDVDFWAVDELPNIPLENSSRIKFWMPIYGCNESNSLRIWPKSHTQNIKSKYKVGETKINPYISQEDIQKFGKFSVPANKTKEFVLFDDRTIHQGPKNTNIDRFGFRISLETTLFVDSNVLLIP